MSSFFAPQLLSSRTTRINPVLISDYVAPGFSTDNFKLVYLNVDLSLPENQHPQSDLEADEFIERFTIPVATLYADLKRLDSEGFAIEARIASLAEGMEIGRRWRSALGH